MTGTVYPCTRCTSITCVCARVCENAVHAVHGYTDPPPPTPDHLLWNDDAVEAIRLAFNATEEPVT